MSQLVHVSLNAPESFASVCHVINQLKKNPSAALFNSADSIRFPTEKGIQVKVCAIINDILRKKKKRRELGFQTDKI